MLQKDAGFYENMYGTDAYKQAAAESDYVETDAYLQETERYDLPDDYVLELRTYADVEEVHPQFLRKNAARQVGTLTWQGEVIFQYRSRYDHARPFRQFIEHRNGHRYVPFHVDLYGIAFLELDTGRTYCYVPRGFAASGESFIITGIFYDPESNLIAYEGCYWAGTNDVMVGDFSDPLHFDPHLISMQELLDPEMETYEELDVVSWGRDGLTVGESGKPPVTISTEVLRQKLEEVRI